MNHKLLAIAAGIVSGMLALASLSGASIAVFFLTLVHPLPLVCVGLALGARAALIAAASAVMVMGLASPYSGLVYGVVYALPIWVIVRLSLTGPHGVVWDISEGQSASLVKERAHGGTPPSDMGWFPAGSLIAVLTAMGGALVVIGSLLTGGGLEEFVNQALAEMAKVFAGPQGEDVLQQAVMALAPLFAGMTAAMWVNVLLVNMVIAQGLVAKGGRNIRPSPQLRELKLPDWLSWALVGAALVALLMSGEIGYIGRSLVFVLAVPFFFLGLAVVHKLASFVSFPGALLGLVYVIVILTGWFALVVAGLGILEQWVGLKSRMDPSA